MRALLVCGLLFSAGPAVSAQVPLQPDTLHFPAFTWPSTPPETCPFRPSAKLAGLRFLGRKSGFHFGDTWYPSWASDDRMYSPWTDGACWRLDGSYDQSGSYKGDEATTGQAVIEGSDPMNLRVYSLGTRKASSLPYHGRYPCGTLVYNHVWYYGTYCLDPSGEAQYGGMVINWPWMGPLVGFRYSTDLGRSWRDCPLAPASRLFGETGINGYPVKIGSPHFVDFGKNMEHSPDGKAYLVAHGADISDTATRFWNDSWITGDQVYLMRVIPGIDRMNDPAAYEFYGGKDSAGRPVWTHDFQLIRPLLAWNNHMGCVTVTYDAPLKKYLMWVTDGGNTTARMDSYLLEADALDGDWKLVSYLKDFGQQGYFLNLPSRFISADGKKPGCFIRGISGRKPMAKRF